MTARISGILVGLALSAMAVTAAADVAVVFTQKEIAVIIDYYGGRHHNDRGGKHKHRGLPPGIAKNLARGKPLPPGIARQHLPDDLLVRLPPVREGYERVIIDGKVILVEIATQVVHDVLSDIILK
jgi:hypothetical protein